MDKTQSHISAPKPQHRREPVPGPMAQQRCNGVTGSTQQMLVKLIGCHDPAKRMLPGRTAGGRSAVDQMFTE
ncbi:conserved hypothetical protein [Bradyrhizobium sp. ORS 375]|uniref:hypothetical protein n=1 Tax=Bradyrhizobium sp. (strain ORS 375) TaxID=566679 RepID=UPI0002409BEA|nr:hypothetical protein [Bradyrhizobium sp. ORS 375]CCD92817.1 conserved hypothetical protein [Bradyrhizobium sp. ORS 375]